MRNITRVLTAAVAAISLVGAAGAFAQQHTHGAYQSDADIALLSPSTWFKNAPNGGITMDFNPANPAGWAVIINPQTHTSWHMAFSNPATYAQFMKPQFYMQFMNPKNWLSWVNPASYATFFDPNTYAYWMTPHAYVHAINPENYLQAVNGSNYVPFFSLDTYGEWLNLDAYNVFGEPKGTIAGGAGVNYFAGIAKWLGYNDASAQASN